MRVIERQMLRAIKEHRNWSSGNTRVEFVTPHAWRVTLHGNLIANGGHSAMSFTLAGWNTPTTRSRVNALLWEFGGKCRVFQHKHEPYFTTDPASREAEREISSDEWITVQRGVD